MHGSGVPLLLCVAGGHAWQGAGIIMHDYRRSPFSWTSAQLFLQATDTPDLAAKSDYGGVDWSISSSQMHGRGLDRRMYMEIRRCLT